MMELIAALLLIALTVIYFLIRSKSKGGKEKDEKKSSKNKNKSNFPVSSNGKVQEKSPQSIIKSTASIPAKNENNNITLISDQSKIVEPKSILLNSFREGKELRNPFTSKDGKIILFHDDKHIYLSFLNSFVEKTPKFLSKTVEQDVITDASYSEDKR
jgi:hypothetical protein